MGSGGDRATLIGRDRELAALQRALTTAQGGHGQVLVIEGEAGIGKTQIVGRLASAAIERGFEVREGACDDIVAARPFAPLAAAIGARHDADDEAGRALASLLAEDRREGPGAHLAVSAAEFRAIEVIGAVVEKLAEARPLVLIVEDLHWADPSTLAALRSIARRVRLLPVVVAVTLRPGHGREDLHRLVEAVLRDGATRLALGPLASQDVAALALAVLGEEPSPALLVRLEGASGNPLFVREFLEALTSGAEAEGLPVEFRLAVLRRVGQLSDETNEALRVAAVLGVTFAAADLAAVLGLTSVALASRLGQAVDSGVIGERGDRLAFRHDLVRAAIYEHMPLDVRRQLHRQAGEALAAASAAPLAVAHHLSLSAEAHDEDAADWLRRAARDVQSRAPGIAAQLLERACDLLPATSPQRDAALADLVLPLAWAGRLPEAEAISLELLARKPTPEVAGALRCGLVYALLWQGRSRDAVAYTNVGDGEELLAGDAALLDAEAALAHMFAFDFPAAVARAQAAEAAARPLGHELALCQALAVKGWVANFRGERQLAVDLCREAIDIADRSASGVGHLAHPRFFPGIALINLDRVEEAQTVLQRGRQISEELGLVWALPLYHAHLGACGFVAGDWDGAIADLTTCLTIADEHPANIAVHMAAHAWLTVMQVRRDDLDAAEATVRHGLQLPVASQAGGLFPWAQAVLAEAKGETDRALALLEPAFEAFLRAGATGADPWTAVSLVRVLLRAGDPDRAAAVASVIAEQRDEAETASITALKQRCRGLVDGDIAVLLDAVDSYRRSARPVDLADTAVDAALCLLDAARVEEAGPLLDEALEIYEAVGAARDAARVRAELRVRGVSRGARGKRTRATTGWESLTDTERRVAALVAKRMSNPEVAQRLFVSRHTVESHLKNIYRKLGVSSRRELAAAADASA